MKAPPSYPNPLLRRWHFGNELQQVNPWYRTARCVLRVLCCSLLKVRVFNRHYEPADGGTVYICNHQSYLDPILMSIGLRRPINYMARESLFRLGPFTKLIESVNAFPVRRATADTRAIKEAIRRIKKGGQVVVFPEGTRTSDARIGPFLPGVAILAQRAAKWAVPVLIDGAHEAWPKTQMLPGLGNIIVQYGRPIPQEEAKKLKPHAFVDQMRQSLIAMQADVRRRVGRPELKYD